MSVWCYLHPQLLHVMGSDWGPWPWEEGLGVRGAAVLVVDWPQAPLPGWALLSVHISITCIYQAAIAMETLKMVLFQAS